MYKEQRGREALRKFSFSVFIWIQKEELQVSVSGHHSSGQESRQRQETHYALELQGGEGVGKAGCSVLFESTDSLQNLQPM